MGYLRMKRAEIDKTGQQKLILDACCGGRRFWFNKNHPLTLYIDNRGEPKGCSKHRPNFSIQPDVVMDFRNLDLPENTFKLIVWDPPHLVRVGKNARLAIEYGSINKEEWQNDLARGFNELWRVLSTHGTLIFKWSETDIPIKEVLACFSEQPLFGHRTTTRGTTIWLAFFKEEE